MLIRMVTSIPGSYDHGLPWPPAGGVIDVPHDVGRDLILGGHAVDAAAPPPASVPAPPPPAPAATVVSQPSATAAGPVSGFIPGDGSGLEDAKAAEPEPLAAPGPADPKADWVAWAMTRPDPPPSLEAAKAMPKVDLMSRYGGRL